MTSLWVLTALFHGNKGFGPLWGSSLDSTPCFVLSGINWLFAPEIDRGRAASTWHRVLMHRVPTQFPNVASKIPRFCKPFADVAIDVQPTDDLTCSKKFVGSHVGEPHCLATIPFCCLTCGRWLLPGGLAVAGLCGLWSLPFIENVGRSGGPTAGLLTGIWQLFFATLSNLSPFAVRLAEDDYCLVDLPSLGYSLPSTDQSSLAIEAMALRSVIVAFYWKRGPQARLYRGPADWHLATFFATLSNLAYTQLRGDLQRGSLYYLPKHYWEDILRGFWEL